MQNRSKPLKIILILFLDVCLIKYGSCAPQKSRMDNYPQKFKRSAGFMNYLSSMFCKTSFNYPYLSWNFNAPPSPPESSYEGNYYQYLDDSENSDKDENYNWPEQDVKKTSYLETVPKDVPLVLNNAEKDDSVIYTLDKDCEYDDLSWNFPPPGIDESIFHNFYLIPEEGDFITESVPTTTTKNPVEQSIQNRNEAEEERTPNITILNCSSNPGQKEFLEKVLYSNNDEYMVLLIKRNSFLGALGVKEEQENKKETVLQARFNNETVVEIQEDVAVPKQSHSNATKFPTEISEKAEHKIIDTDVVRNVSRTTDIATSTVFTTQEEAATFQQNNKKSGVLEETTKVGNRIDDDGTEVDLNLKGITKTGSSTKIIATPTISTPIVIQEQFVKLSTIPIEEENENNSSTKSENEIRIPNEGSIDNQPVKIVEIQRKGETMEKTDAERKVHKDALEKNTYIDLETSSMKEKKIDSVLQIADENLNNISEAKEEILTENIEDKQKDDSVHFPISVVGINDYKISTISPQIEYVSLFPENLPTQPSTILNPNEVQVNSENPAILEDPIVAVTLANIKSDEDEKIFLKPADVSSVEEITKNGEDRALLQSENNLETTPTL